MEELLIIWEDIAPWAGALTVLYLIFFLVFTGFVLFFIYKVWKDMFK